MATTFGTSQTTSAKRPNPALINEKLLQRLSCRPSHVHIRKLFVLKHEELEDVKQKVYDILERYELVETTWSDVQSHMRDIIQEFSQDAKLQSLTSMNRWEQDFPLPNEWEKLRQQGIRGIVQLVHRHPKRYEEKEDSDMSYNDETPQNFNDGPTSRRPHREARFSGKYQSDSPLTLERKRGRSLSSDAHSPRPAPAYHDDNVFTTFSHHTPSINLSESPEAPSLGESAEVLNEVHKNGNMPTTIPNLKRFEISSERLPQSQVHSAFDIGRAAFKFYRCFFSASGLDAVIMLPHEITFSNIALQVDENDPSSYSIEKILDCLETREIGFKRTMHGVYWFHDNEKLPIQSQDDLVRSLWIRKNQLEGDQTVLPYYLYPSSDPL